MLVRRSCTYINKFLFLTFYLSLNLPFFPIVYVRILSWVINSLLPQLPISYSSLEDLIHNRLKPPPNWRHEFAEYISDLPTYYAQPLRNAMRLLGASTSLVPDFFDGQVNPEITSFLKKMRKQVN